MRRGRTPRECGGFRAPCAAEGFEPPGRRNSLAGEEKRGGSTAAANNGSGGAEGRREEKKRGEAEREREGTYGTVLWNCLFIFLVAGHVNYYCVNSGCD